MAVLDPMYKMISFRLSDDEYQQLMEMCLATNTRSMSQMARTAIHEFLEHGPAASDNDLHQKVAQLEQRVTELSVELERFCRSSAGR